jgi:hypothetical protein
MRAIHQEHFKRSGIQHKKLGGKSRFDHSELEIKPFKILNFNFQALTVLKINQETNANKVLLRQQPFAKADKLHDSIAENYKDIRKRLPKICHSMAIYLANKDIEHIIFKRIKVRRTFNNQIILTNKTALVDFRSNSDSVLFPSGSVRNDFDLINFTFCLI